MNSPNDAITITRQDVIETVRIIIHEFGYIDISGSGDDIEATGDEIWKALNGEPLITD